MAGEVTCFCACVVGLSTLPAPVGLAAVLGLKGGAPNRSTATYNSIRARLYQVSASKKCQCCDDTNDIAVIEITGNKKSRSRKGLQPILARLYSFQRELRRKRHRIVAISNDDTCMEHSNQFPWY